MILRVTGLLIALSLALLIGGALPVWSASQSQLVMYQEARRLMWTKFEIIAYGPDRARLAEAAEAAFEEIERLDHQMSNYSETSELTYINRNAAREDVVVEFTELDKQGLRTPIPLWMERNAPSIPWVKEEYDRVKAGKIATTAGDIPPVK